MVLARATQSVIGFTDALLVAPLGEEALAAVTTGSLNTFAVIIFPMGTVFIVQSFTAQLHGRNELGGIRRYAGYGLFIALVCGILAGALIPLVRPLLGLLDYAPRVHDLMSTYLSIRLLSVGAAAGTEALGNWYGGLGNTRPAMVAGVLTMLVNLLGAYALIEPRFGLPGYGVTGAAWASVGASWLGFLSLLAWFLLGRGYAKSQAPIGFSSAEFRRVLRFGIPNGVNWFLEFAAFTLYINVVVAHLGTTVLAAFNVVMQINSLSFMPAFGLASAGAILAGDAIGRREHDQVWPIVRLTAAVGGAWMLSIGLLYALLPGTFIGWFTPRDVPARALLEAGTTMLTMAAIWQLFDALALTFSEALRAAGDTAWCMGARIVLAWFLFTPLAWALVFWLEGGVITVMVSLIAYIAALALAFAARFASGAWRKIDLVGGDPARI